MTKEIYISTTPHETRLAIVEDEQLAEVHYERENEYTLAGAIYNGKVTRVLPGMQSAFVDVGLERDAFLYVTDFLEEQEDSGEFERSALPDRRPAKQLPAEPADEAAFSEPSTEAVAEPAEARASTNSDAGSDDSNRRSRQRRGRGGRDRDRGRDRGDRNRGRERESAPTTSAAPEREPSYESRSEEPRRHEPVAAHGTPVLLPGESLSKYGRRDRAEASSDSSSTSAPTQQAPQTGSFYKPSTLVAEVPLAWDGSGVLPGESLSRKRRDAQQQQQTPAFSHHEPELPSEPQQREEQRFSQDSEFDQHAQAGTSHAHAPEVTELHDFEFSDHVVEEPTHASASHSVNPATTSEYRASAPVADVEEEEQTEDNAMEADEFIETPAQRSEEVEAAPVTSMPEPAFADKPEIVYEDQDDFEDFSSSTFANSSAEPTPEQREMAHEFGHEMASHAPQEVEIFPAVPAFLDEIDSEADANATLARHLAHHQEQVEEETIEGEEFDFEPLHMHHDGVDSDDLVEETIESQYESSDLTDAVREQHVDDRTADFDEDSDSEDFDEMSSEESEEESEEPSEAVANGAPATERRQPRQPGRGRGRLGRQRSGGGRGRPGSGGPRRQSMQSTSLPIITELLKPGQEILVQIAKEPIAKKGARITSHIALPGRFLVYMPTVNHVGVSRKIASDEERQRLKRILMSEKGEANGGFIVRTAAGSANEQELRADIRFLINLWTEIKQRSEDSKSPALIYHDLNLVERILRDQVTDRFSAIWVDTEAEYERVVKFLSRFQPSLVRHVKLYTKSTPLFEQFGIQEEINKALRSKVWLKSGGSIVINQTEALVAIDINTGKYVGKTARLEDTILKTNLDAIPEIVRQIRLRDLGGIIVIDFIDMDERRNRHKVMAALEEALKVDRAPSKVLQFNDFGLVAITRKRVKQSLERTLSVPCTICTGTGMVKSPTTVCNEIYVELRKMHEHLERGEIMLRVHPEVVKQLKANGAKWLQEMEEMAGRTILVKSDPALHPEQFDIH
jgi:ribonuclease G